MENTRSTINKLLRALSRVGKDDQYGLVFVTLDGQHALKIEFQKYGPRMFAYTFGTASQVARRHFIVSAFKGVSHLYEKFTVIEGENAWNSEADTITGIVKIHERQHGPLRLYKVLYIDLNKNNKNRVVNITFNVAPKIVHQQRMRPVLNQLRTHAQTRINTKKRKANSLAELLAVPPRALHSSFPGGQNYHASLKRLKALARV